LAEDESVRDLYGRLTKLFDKGRLNAAQMRNAIELVKLRTSIVQADDVERRLAALSKRRARPDAEDG
jgi:hypothetical protein